MGIHAHDCMSNIQAAKMMIRNVSPVILAFALLGIGPTAAMGGCCCDGISGLPVPNNCNAVEGDDGCCARVGAIYVALMSGGGSGCQAADCTELLRTSPLVQMPSESSFVERVPAGASAIVKEEDVDVDLAKPDDDKVNMLVALADEDKDSGAAEQTTNSQTKKQAKAAPKMPRHSLQDHPHSSVAETDVKENMIKERDHKGRQRDLTALAARHSNGQQGKGQKGPGKIVGHGKRSQESQAKKVLGKNGKIAAFTSKR